jgi:hypothetical protein
MTTTTTMTFIDTFDDDDDVTLNRIIMNDDKYDQLSQINTSWVVMFPEEKYYYDADDEAEEEVIKQ